MKLEPITFITHQIRQIQQALLEMLNIVILIQEVSKKIFIFRRRQHLQTFYNIMNIVRSSRWAIFLISIYWYEAYFCYLIYFLELIAIIWRFYINSYEPARRVSKDVPFFSSRSVEVYGENFYRMNKIWFKWN